MNRHILLVALILSISIFGNVLAKKVSQKDQNTIIHNQPKDDEREEELILLPEILDRLEGGSGDDDSDLGPELPPSSYSSDSDSKDNSSIDEPNLLSIEDDSDEDDNIFKPSNPIDHSNETPVYNETPENQEKNLLNIDHGEVEVGEDSDDTDTTNSVPNGGDIETEEEDFGNSPTSDNEGGIGFTTVETESVVIDGQYHMFDVAPCTVIKIPIGKRRVRVDAENIFNSNMTLLTDAQLTNCSELANFECPQDATFCRKGALASNNVAEIELEQEACGVEDAYLYVLPLDAAIALSYKVRVEDIGQPLCDDNSEAKTDEDTEEVQEPELIPTESDDSDDSDDSDNSDDRDDTDIAEDINDDQIFEGDARVDGKLHSYDLDACTVLTIPIKKRPVKIVVDDIFNSGKVMVTDVKLATCTELIEFRCPSNNTFCQIEDLDDFEGLEDGIQLTSQACNTDIAYLYVLPETDGGLVSFEARIKKLKNYSCSTQEDSSPLPVVIIDTTPTDNSTSADNTTDATTPAPSTQESTDSQSDVPAIGDNEDNQVDSTTNTSQGIADTGSNSNGGTIVLIIFGSSFAIFLAVVCIYRRQFKKNRVEMFSPPAWCPNCLFPRMPVRMMSNPTGYGQIDYNEYEPPVL